MLKEQVQKHGEVIKWFCDNPDKGVWHQAELSKAIVDRKTLEYT